MKSLKSNSTNTVVNQQKAKPGRRLFAAKSRIKNPRTRRILLTVGVIVIAAALSLVIYNQFIKDSGEQLIPGSTELPPEPQLSEPTFAQ